MQQHRQLAAILFTDIVGYTSMMQKDEQGAVAVIQRHHSVMENTVTAHQGEIHSFFGDGCLCIFSSATEAVRCAIEVQQQLQTGLVVPLRIGLHIGEIFFEQGKVMGDGVNIASRFQSLGQANTILFSKEIFDKLRNQPGFRCVSLGFFEFKNVHEPMEVFALANEGLKVPKREEMSGKLKEIKKESAHRKWIWMAAGTMLLTIGWLIYQNLSPAKGFAGGDKTVAVLPFENTGTDSSEEYISDGITQDIIKSLSSVSSLKKVIGWFSVKGFKKTTKSLNEISKELGVGAIFSGTVEKIADKTRIIVELIEANTGKRLWGDDFEYASKDVISIQSKIAGEIVNAMKASITPEEKKELSRQYTENPEAYKLYRKGLFFWNKNNQASFDTAELYYKKALDIDPEYALAYSGLANCYLFSGKIVNQLEGIPIAKMYTEKALSLDSNLAEALATKALIQSYFDYDWAKSKIILQKAIQRNSNNPEAHLYYGNLLQYTGENMEEGIKEVKRALELDPLNSRFNWVLGRNYYLARQYDLAYQQLKKTLILDPNYIRAKGTLILSYLEKKMYPEAFRLIGQLSKTPVMNLSWQDPFLCYALALSGDTAGAKSILRNTLKEYPDQDPYFLVYAYIGLKNYNEAINMLDAAYKVRAIELYWVKVDPELDPIRNEPRFKALLKKMNLD
jgi:adenylate cyclase